MKRIKRKLDGEMFAYNEVLAKRPDMEVVEVDMEAPAVKPRVQKEEKVEDEEDVPGGIKMPMTELQALKRGELMRLGGEHGLKDMFKMKNHDMVNKLYKIINEIEDE